MFRQARHEKKVENYIFHVDHVETSSDLKEYNYYSLFI